MLCYLLANRRLIKDPHDLVMVGVFTADISDSSILIKVPSESISCIEVGTVSQRDPGTSKDMIVVAINGRQSKIIVKRIHLEALHNCQD